MALTYSTTRRVTPVQLKPLYAHAWWTRKRSLPQIRTLLKHSDLLATCWEGKELVGFCRVSTDFAFRAVLWDVIVRSEHQRKGIGRKLVRSVLKHPRLRGVEGFWLFTTESQAFYRKLGFRLYPRNLMVFRKKGPRR